MLFMCFINFRKKDEKIRFCNKVFKNFQPLGH